MPIIGIAPIMWLADERYSIWTIVALFTWQFGSSMVVFLAALQNIPKSLYEAADMDGASRFQQFWRITVPLLTPVIFFNLIMQLVHGFQEFNGPYMVTEGGPLNSTYLLSLYIYEESFRYFNLGYGSALSWVMFALVGGFSALSFWSSKYWVFYAGEGSDEAGARHAKAAHLRPGEVQFGDDHAASPGCTRLEGKIGTCSIRTSVLICKRELRQFGARGRQWQTTHRRRVTCW